jgi:hypothetical protein
MTEMDYGCCRIYLTMPFQLNNFIATNRELTINDEMDDMRE